MPRPPYDNISWTTNARPHSDVSLTLHIKLSGQGNNALMEEAVKQTNGYKLAFRIKANQTVELQFYDLNGQAIRMQPDPTGQNEIDQLYRPDSGEKWVALVSLPGQNRAPSYPNGQAGYLTDYAAHLTISPLSVPQVILCAHAYRIHSYRTHHRLSALLLD